MQKILLLCILVLTFSLEARHPRLNVSFEYGDVASLWLDAFLPPLVNNDTAVFIDFQTQINRFTSRGNLAYIISPGIGMRKQFGSQVVGAYLFADYIQSHHKEKYWAFGPGIDFYKGRFSFVLNTYLPFGHDEHIESKTTRYNITTVAAGHQALQTTYYKTKTKRERLPYGADITAYYIPENTRFFGELGCYYYNIKHLKPTTGIRAGIGFFLLPNLKFEIKEKYDNESGNRIVGRIEMSLGGVFNGGIKTKLTYPIYRHFNVNTTKKGTSAKTYTKSSESKSYHHFDNLFFISTVSTPSPDHPQTGTFENPFISVDLALNGTYPTAIAAPPLANFWITGNDNSLAGSKAIFSGKQTLAGRTANFQAPATNPADMPIITTQMVVKGDSGFFQDFQLVHTEPTTLHTADRIASNLTEHKTLLAHTEHKTSTLPTPFFPALDIQSGSTVEINNLVITASATIPVKIGGLSGEAGTTVTIVNSIFNVSHSGTESAIGCYFEGDILNVTGGSFTTSGTTDVTGVHIAEGTATFNASSGSTNISATNSTATGTATGIHLAGASIPTINNCTTSASGGGTTIAADCTTTHSVAISGGSFTANGSTTVTGISNSNGLTVTGSAFKASGSGTVTGVHIAGSTAIFNQTVGSTLVSATTSAGTATGMLLSGASIPTINNCTTSATGTGAAIAIAADCTTTNSVAISGGSFTANGSTTVTGISKSSNANLTVTDSAFTASGSGTVTGVHIAGGVATFNQTVGSTLVSATTSAGTATGMLLSGASIPTINNCTTSATGGGTTIAADCTTTHSVAISGGSFTANGSTTVTGISNSNGLTVTGSAFTASGSGTVTGVHIAGGTAIFNQTVGSTLVSATTSAGTATGMLLSDASIPTINNCTTSATGTGAAIAIAADCTTTNSVAISGGSFTSIGAANLTGISIANATAALTNASISATNSTPTGTVTGIQLSGTSTPTINNCTTVATGGGTTIAVDSTTSNNIGITAGSFTANGSTTVTGISKSSNANLTVTDSAFTASGSGTVTGVHIAGGVATFNQTVGSTLVSATTSAGTATGMLLSGASIPTINNCTTSATGTGGATAIAASCSTSGLVTISGGSFTSIGAANLTGISIANATAALTNASISATNSTPTGTVTGIQLSGTSTPTINNCTTVATGGGTTIAVDSTTSNNIGITAGSFTANGSTTVTGISNSNANLTVTDSAFTASGSGTVTGVHITGGVATFNQTVGSTLVSATASAGTATGMILSTSSTPTITNYITSATGTGAATAIAASCSTSGLVTISGGSLTATGAANLTGISIANTTAALTNASISANNSTTTGTVTGITLSGTSTPTINTCTTVATGGGTTIAVDSTTSNNIGITAGSLTAVGPANVIGIHIHPTTSTPTALLSNISTITATSSSANPSDSATAIVLSGSSVPTIINCITSANGISGATITAVNSNTLGLVTISGGSFTATGTTTVTGLEIAGAGVAGVNVTGTTPPSPNVTASSTSRLANVTGVAVSGLPPLTLDKSIVTVSAPNATAGLVSGMICDTTNSLTVTDSTFEASGNFNVTGVRIAGSTNATFLSSTLTGSIAATSSSGISAFGLDLDGSARLNIIKHKISATHNGSTGTATGINLNGRFRLTIDGCSTTSSATNTASVFGANFNGGGGSIVDSNLSSFTALGGAQVTGVELNTSISANFIGNLTPSSVISATSLSTNPSDFAKGFVLKGRAHLTSMTRCNIEATVHNNIAVTGLHCLDQSRSVFERTNITSDAPTGGSAPAFSYAVHLQGGLFIPGPSLTMTNCMGVASALPGDVHGFVQVLPSTFVSFGVNTFTPP